MGIVCFRYVDLTWRFLFVPFVLCVTSAASPKDPLRGVFLIKQKDQTVVHSQLMIVRRSVGQREERKEGRMDCGADLNLTPNNKT